MEAYRVDLIEPNCRLIRHQTLKITLERGEYGTNITIGNKCLHNRLKQCSGEVGEKNTLVVGNLYFTKVKCFKRLPKIGLNDARVSCALTIGQ